MSETATEKNRIYRDLISTVYNDIKDYINSEDGNDLTYLEIASLLNFIADHFKDNSQLDMVNMTDILIKRKIRNSRDKHYCRECYTKMKNASDGASVAICEECAKL